MKNPIKLVKIKIRALKSDVRHGICTLITAVSVGVGIVLFPNALTALLTAVADLVTSFLYYVFEMLDIGINPIHATVTDPLKWRPFEEIWKPITLLPSSVEEWSGFWRRYFAAFINIGNVELFFDSIVNTVYYISRFAVLLLPTALIIYFKVQGIKDKVSFDRHAQSRQLVRFKRFENKIVYPIISYIKDFISFLRVNHGYVKTWTVLWLL